MADCQYMHALVYGLPSKGVHERKVCTVYSYLSGQRCVFSKVCTKKVWDLDVVEKIFLWVILYQYWNWSGRNQIQWAEISTMATSVCFRKICKHSRYFIVWRIFTTFYIFPVQCIKLHTRGHHTKWHRLHTNLTCFKHDSSFLPSLLKAQLTAGRL